MDILDAKLNQLIVITSYIAAKVLTKNEYDNMLENCRELTETLVESEPKKKAGRPKKTDNEG